MGKTAALLILAIVSPLSALASDVFIAPAAPTSQTAVTLHVTGGSASAGTSFGTDIPVVPEESFAGGVGIHNVPVVAGTRTTLRIYALNTGTPNTVSLSVTRGGKSTYTTLTLSRLTAETPTFAIIPDLDAAFPSSAAPTMDISLGDDKASSKYWALVTVTTNDTQQVTVIRL